MSRDTFYVTLCDTVSGMEGGESPSVADYFVVAGLDDNATLVQPPQYVSYTPPPPPLCLC